MKRRLLFVMVLALMLTALAGTVGAQSDDPAPAPDITALAGYFPDNADNFVALRMDSGYAAQLDGVVALLSQTIPDLEGVNATLLLDAIAFELTGQSFAEGIDPWLGDSIALSLVDTGATLQAALDTLLITEASTGTGEPVDPAAQQMEMLAALADRVPLMFAVGIDDRAAAEAFFTSGILQPLGPVAPAEGVELPGFDVFAFEQLPLLVALGEDAILLMTPATVELLDFDAPLSASADFTNVVAQMPQGTTYNIFSYADTASVVAGVGEVTNELLEAVLMQTGDMMGMGMVGNLAAFSSATASLEGVLGPQAVGFTLIDGRSATIDSVSVMGPDAMPVDLAMETVDPAFAQYIPAYAQLVIHDNGYGPENLAVFDALDTITPAIDMALDEVAASGMLDGITIADAVRMLGGPGMSRSDVMMVMQFLDFYELTPEDPVTALFDLVEFSDVQIGGLIQTQVNTLFGGFTGLNLTEDVLGWMTGDYAFHTSLVPVESDLDFTFDFGFVTEATDPAAAANVVARLTEAADAYRLGYMSEEIGGGSALALTAPVRLLLQEDIPAEVLAETPELDFVIGANEDVYVVSSRPGAEYALAQDGPSLADDPTFAYAAETLVLPDSVSVWYVGVPAFIEALPALSEAAPANDLYGLAQLASLFESMTISASPFDAGVATRFTLTFEDEPSIPAELEEAIGEGMMEPAPMPTVEAEQAPGAEMTEEAAEEPAQQAPEPEATEEPGN